MRWVCITLLLPALALQVSCRPRAKKPSALSDEPDTAYSFFLRARAWHAEKDYDKAIADCDRALALDPQYTIPYSVRGDCWRAKKEYSKAAADFQKAIDIDADDIHALSRLSWLHSTCPAAEFRDGKKALELARKLCEVTHWEVGNSFDSFAAALAENGDFDEAVKWQQKAINDPEFTKLFGEDGAKRLELYKQRMPFREE
jgi:tetratricopeptide (TPR) repeat protein